MSEFFRFIEGQLQQQADEVRKHYESMSEALTMSAEAFDRLVAEEKARACAAKLAQPTSPVVNPKTK